MHEREQLLELVRDGIQSLSDRQPIGRWAELMERLEAVSETDSGTVRQIQEALLRLREVLPEA